MTSLPLPGRWAIAQPKIKILAWNFVQLLMAHSSIAYIPFLYPQHFQFCWHFFVKNRNFDFWGSKARNFENPRWPFCRACNVASFGICWLRFTLKSYIPEAFESWPFFRPKIAWHDVTKTPFSWKFLDEFHPNFCLRMPNWCWIGCRKFYVDICNRF